jgi:hypothetical protein
MRSAAGRETMIRGCCPGCGLVADLDVFAAQAEVPAALKAALDLPPRLSGRTIAYLRLFSPPKKSLALAKTTRLLTELGQAIQTAEVRRHGISWVAPLELWERALDIILASPPAQLPLTDHNYLFQIVANLASQVAKRAEQQQEEQRQHPIGPRANEPQAVAAMLPAVAPAIPVPAPTRRGPPPGWREDVQAVLAGTKKVVLEETSHESISD